MKRTCNCRYYLMYLWKRRAIHLYMEGWSRMLKNMDMRGWRTGWQEDDRYSGVQAGGAALTDADSVDITDSEAVMEYAHQPAPLYCKLRRG